SLYFSEREEGQAGDLPAFHFSEWEHGEGEQSIVSKGVVARLPVPTAAFGLDLSGTMVTDAGLKELARFKSLQALKLANVSEVTDGGWKELTALKGLQSLDLSQAMLTDAGLKELAHLKGLQMLNLSATGMTNGRLKELTAFKSLQTLKLGYTEVTD